MTSIHLSGCGSSAAELLALGLSVVPLATDVNLSGGLLGSLDSTCLSLTYAGLWLSGDSSFFSSTLS
eukprot:7402249-Karenia_brevis.AAC.1